MVPERVVLAVPALSTLQAALVPMRGYNASSRPRAHLAAIMKRLPGISRADTGSVGGCVTAEFSSDAYPRQGDVQIEVGHTV